MLELKPIKQMMQAYETLIAKYDDELTSLDSESLKRIIREVKLFWHRHHRYVNYFLNHIEKVDRVAFLAGAVRLDIVSGGEKEFILVGNARIINDPLLKLDVLYQAEGCVDTDYANQYIKECIKDVSVLLKNYRDDFYVLPLEEITNGKNEEYYTSLTNAAERIVLSMFTDEYQTVEDIWNNNNSYEDIEGNLVATVKELIIFSTLEDTSLSLREKCERYLFENKEQILLYQRFDEAKVFYMLMLQYIMQILAIIMTMKNYNMIPFIRNDVTFQFFNMVYCSNILDNFTQEEYLNAYIPYVLQRCVSFEELAYSDIKERMGNNCLIDAIKNQKPGEVPDVKEIIATANDFI